MTEAGDSRPPAPPRFCSAVWCSVIAPPDPFQGLAGRWHFSHDAGRQGLRVKIQGLRCHRVGADVGALNCAHTDVVAHDPVGDNNESLDGGSRDAREELTAFEVF